MVPNKFQLECACWLQQDAAYLYRMAATKRDSDAWARDWVATKIQDNAAHSAKRARIVLGIEESEATA
jgi:hypothetical protein